MQPLNPRRARATRLAAWAGLWTILGLVFATQLFISEQRFAPHPSTWWQALRSELPDWYLWGLLALVVRWMSRRFRIDRESWERTVPMHFGASLTLSFAHVVLSTAVQQLLGTGSASYPQRLVDTFTTSFHWNLLVYWAIAALLHARAYARDAAEGRVRAAELETAIARARLQALTLQLRPHFLFNTLNAVAELIHEDPDTAERMVGRLSDLLRWTLDTDGAQEVPLARELELVDRYLEIERVRFPDRLQIRLDVAAEARAAAVPAMILLPLVENAVRHGVAARTGAGRGAVGVRAWRSGTALRLEVWDDGPGLAAAPRSSAGSGIGLSNTAARLEQLYGREQRLELENGAAGGLTVRVTLPFRGGAAA